MCSFSARPWQCEASQMDASRVPGNTRVVLGPPRGPELFELPPPTTSELLSVIFDLPGLLLTFFLQLQVADVGRAAAVCCGFARIAASDVLWEPLCKTRWCSKWGFTSRCARAAAARAAWREMYHQEELDAGRNTISVAELQALVFDFRFRLDVMHSASTSMRFGPPQWKDGDTNIPEGPGIVARGSVSGHPLNDDRITWVLSNDGRSLQWGVWPRYWPMGGVRRLPSWGWEVINPNVVMRALDETLSPEVSARAMWADLVDHLFAMVIHGEVRLIPQTWVEETR